MKPSEIPYLVWIQKTPRKKQAWLREPFLGQPDTPKHFYHFEMEFHSNLSQRVKARGIPLKGDENAPQTITS